MRVLSVLLQLQLPNFLQLLSFEDGSKLIHKLSLSPPLPSISNCFLNHKETILFNDNVNHLLSEDTDRTGVLIRIENVDEMEVTIEGPVDLLEDCLDLELLTWEVHGIPGFE